MSKEHHKKGVVDQKKCRKSASKRKLADIEYHVQDNAYSTPFLHEDLDVDHKMVILGIGWYHNTFSDLSVQHQH